jgi:MerR HTH family regulatory protein
MKPRHTSAKGASKRKKQGFETTSPSKAEPLKPKKVSAIQLFEPSPGTAYPIEQLSQLAGIPRRRILIYCKERLVTPMANPDMEGYWFDAKTLRTLKQIEELRSICGEPLAGVKVILDLMREVQRLRSEMRALEI